MPFFSLVISFLDYSVTFTFLVNRVSELFVRSKMAITLELKLCLSNFSRGIEKQNSYLGRNIEFSLVQLIYFFNTLFSTDFANFQKEADRLSVNSLIDKDPKWLFFMSWSNFRLWLSNPSQISSINAMVTFLWLIKRVYFFLTHPVSVWKPLYWLEF